MFGHFPLLSQFSLSPRVCLHCFGLQLALDSCLKKEVFFPPPPPSQTRGALLGEVLQVQIQTAHLPTHLHSTIIPVNAQQIKAARGEIWQARMPPPPVIKSTVEVTNRNVKALPCI
jgi:hypothetical protein